MSDGIAQTYEDGRVKVNFTRHEFFELLRIKWINYRKTWKRRNRCPDCKTYALIPVKKSHEVPRGFCCLHCGWVIFEDSV